MAEGSFRHGYTDAAQQLHHGSTGQEAYTNYAVLRLTHGMGLLDSLVAATAAGLGEPVATFNKRHFEAVPGLVTVQPYTR
jgi:predicted nucleic acid-binding protein